MCVTNFRKNQPKCVGQTQYFSRDHDYQRCTVPLFSWNWNWNWNFLVFRFGTGTGTGTAIFSKYGTGTGTGTGYQFQFLPVPGTDGTDLFFQLEKGVLFHVNSTNKLKVIGLKRKQIYTIIHNLTLI